MRRFLALVFVLGLAIPAGISLEGCTRNPGENYCNGLGYGLKYTDLTKLELQPQTTGVSLAFPGTNSFVGEFLTMLGGYLHNSWLAIFSATGVILSAAYALFLYRRIIFGALVKPTLQTIQDLNAREVAILAPLVEAEPDNQTFAQMFEFVQDELAIMA